MIDADTKHKNGVSGFMRVKNDAEFIEASIDSCVGALDELVIVYNDCSDRTPDLIEKKRLEYPEKIRAFEYKHKVYSTNLSKEDYEFVLNQPDDSPYLLCSYYNFALSKVRYRYALKIDADQIYFTERLKRLCDIFRNKEYMGGCFWKYFIGSCFNLYFRFYKLICFKTKRAFPILPERMVRLCYPFYVEYMRARVRKGGVCLSLSGLNVFKDKGKWYVPLGRRDKLINILPPFNGEGDHLIFEVSSETYFRKYNMPYYNLLANTNYSLIEEFVHPYKMLCAGFAWFHLNAMRDNIYDKVVSVKRKYPSCFEEIFDFLNMRYMDVILKVDKEMFSLRQKVLFSFTYKSDCRTILENVDILRKISLNHGMND